MVTTVGGGGGGRSPRMNFRGGAAPPGGAPPGGTRPTPRPASVREVLVLTLVHLCKKSMFFDTNVKVALYLAALFLVSLLADTVSFPKTYFARSDNLLNALFVKLGWFWTLALAGPFAALTSYTHCCGRRERVLKAHLSRLAVATCAWWSWTTLFNHVESAYGRCVPRPAADKRLCLKNGHFWNGLDLSGHCFILVYSSLVLIEEARAIVGWEGIREAIRDEEYARSVGDKTVRSNPMRNLADDEFALTKRCYEQFTPYVRGLFVAMTALQLLWDVMLFCTLLYYHIMVEKFASGAIAILMWYGTYRFWYKKPGLYPSSPGEGVFKYGKEKSAGEKSAAGGSAKKRPSANNGRHFMGMPIYANRPADATEADDQPAPPSPR